MTVYVVQQHMRRNRQTGNLEPTFDVSPAEKFGEIVTLMPPQASPLEDPETVLDQLREKLSDMRDGDHILLCGNPILIGLTAVAASEYVDEVRFLQWSGSERQYLEVTVNWYDGDEE